MTFKDGGAYDFHNFFERIKERFQQAVDAARESDQLGSGGRSGPELAGVNMANVHLEQLPSYGEANGSSLLPPHAPESSAYALHQSMRDSGIGGVRTSEGGGNTKPSGSQAEEAFAQPAEPPPGYEEAQTRSVENELERRLREEAERQ